MRYVETLVPADKRRLATLLSYEVHHDPRMRPGSVHVVTATEEALARVKARAPVTQSQ